MSRDRKVVNPDRNGTDAGKKFNNSGRGTYGYFWLSIMTIKFNFQNQVAAKGLRLAFANKIAGHTEIMG
jgi:hypothetical protein